MTNKKEINDEQLVAASGGAFGFDDEADKANIGRRVYVKNYHHKELSFYGVYKGNVVHRSTVYYCDVLRDDNGEIESVPRPNCEFLD